MSNSKTQLLQKGRAAQITRAARTAKTELEGYLEDLELYSKKEFWEAVGQVESGKVNKYRSVGEFVRKNGG